MSPLTVTHLRALVNEDDRARQKGPSKTVRVCLGLSRVLMILLKACPTLSTTVSSEFLFLMLMIGCGAPLSLARFTDRVRCCVGLTARM